MALMLMMFLNGWCFSMDDVSQWMMLAAASAIAGNLTIFGAASNIIIIEAAESRGVKAFSFFEFLKIGSMVTASNLIIYYLFTTFLFGRTWYTSYILSPSIGFRIVQILVLGDDLTISLMRTSTVVSMVALSIQGDWNTRAFTNPRFFFSVLVHIKCEYFTAICCQCGKYVFSFNTSQAI